VLAADDVRQRWLLSSPIHWPTVMSLSSSASSVGCNGPGCGPRRRHRLLPSGFAIDRYVTTGKGDPALIMGDAMFMLQTEAMLDLVRWMREFNRGRPEHDKVRFLGADVLELARFSSTRSGATSPTSRRNGVTTWRRT
jgi:hypothetical protein